MKQETRQRKQTTRVFKALRGQDWLVDRMYQIVQQGKQGLDSVLVELGRLPAETMMELDREDQAGPDYQPKTRGVYKWAAQPSSVVVGDQTVPVMRPRVRGPAGELPLATHATLKARGPFSEALLGKLLRGLSAQKYRETVMEAAQAVGVSPSAVSQPLIEVTTPKLKAFKERSPADFNPFARFLDTRHRGGEAVIVALGIDLAGHKRVLGFGQGATENHEICDALLGDLATRGCALGKRILFVTDGGTGISNARKAR